jgi:hypothetical protein
VRGKRSPKLERKQRIAGGGGEDVVEGTARQAQPLLLMEQTTNSPKTQRSDLETLDDRATQSTLDRGVRAVALGEQEPDRLAALEPPYGEGERICRRAVKPLDVIDSEKKRLPGSTCPEDSKHRQHERARIRGHSSRVDSEKRNLEGVALGAWQRS